MQDVREGRSVARWGLSIATERRDTHMTSAQRPAAHFTVSSHHMTVEAQRSRNNCSFHRHQVVSQPLPLSALSSVCAAQVARGPVAGIVAPTLPCLYPSRQGHSFIYFSCSSMRRLYRRPYVPPAHVTRAARRKSYAPMQQPEWDVSTGVAHGLAGVSA